ncbi:hypothetical protein chiPu_0024819 [Chiloscyllium punctatum]|uniref:Uncharacterized protein n=1 Tax=Chiloscyllium punctatum TaxID=137246 RepID=A0A401TDI1_CHIPU|nr:hypothetical protein [Chiloscyllium punctatum]
MGSIPTTMNFLNKVPKFAVEGEVGRDAIGNHKPRCKQTLHDHRVQNRARTLRPAVTLGFQPRHQCESG